MTVADQLTRGMQLLKSGRLSDAERIFLNVLAQDAENTHARFALGIASYQSNRLDDAERYLAETVSRSPDFLPAYNNLALVLKALGNPDRAMATLQRALEIQPGYVDARYNLALLQEESGDRTSAIQSYRGVLTLSPDFMRAHTNLGLLLRADGDSATALPHLEAVAKHSFRDVAVLVNLALVFTDLARYDDAISAASRATQLESGNFNAWETLGNAQRLAGDASNAVISLQRAHALNPESLELQYEIGLAQNAAGEFASGRTTLNTVAQLRPDWLKVLFARDLALPLVYLNDQHVVDSNADFVAGIEKIEARLLDVVNWSVQEGVAAISGYAPFYLHYQGLDNTKLQQRFGRIVETVTRRAWPQFAETVAWKPLFHGGRIRIGFVSAYLRRHSVGLFFGNWICQLDAQRFESFVWYSGEAGDAVTEKIRANAAHFSRASDIDALGKEIHASRLDILVYLDVGMHPHSQVLAALKLAPIQCATFGHPVTTGIGSIDYFLSADAAEPDNARQHYTEQLIRLPRFAVSYARPDVSGQRTSSRLARPRQPFLLCAQPLFKILPHFDRVVARIARELPGCSIAFFESLWPRVNEAFVTRMCGALREAGVDPLKTLEMLPIMPYEEYLGTLATADLLLDTPGFSGGNSSFDAFAVGAPVIAWRGEMLRGSQSSAMLDIIGLPELASDFDDDYVRNAITLAADRSRHREVRERISSGTSALFDDTGTIRALEDVLRKLVT